MMAETERRAILHHEAEHRMIGLVDGSRRGEVVTFSPIEVHMLLAFGVFDADDFLQMFDCEVGRA